MTGTELMELLGKAGRRFHLTGNVESGIITALDMEGRLFVVINGKVLNRVVPSSILNRSNKHVFQNPGGDALWPAPEGSCFGYEYATGKWRVPPAITGAVWEVISSENNKAVIRAEIDLVNNLQIGIPCEFERHIEIQMGENSLIQKVNEMIRYIGNRNLGEMEFLLAPWSLCQFDSGINGIVRIPCSSETDIWDLYGPSESKRRLVNGYMEINTQTSERFQLGLSSNVPWVEYISGNQFRVKRYTAELPVHHKYIDIADLPPDRVPSDHLVKLSVYCDPSGFLEIEACGGCPDSLEPGAELRAKITTEYEVIKSL